MEALTSIAYGQSNSQSTRQAEVAGVIASASTSSPSIFSASTSSVSSTSSSSGGQCSYSC